MDVFLGGYDRLSGEVDQTSSYWGWRRLAAATFRVTCDGQSRHPRRSPLESETVTNAVLASYDERPADDVVEMRMTISQISLRQTHASGRLTR